MRRFVCKCSRPIPSSSESHNCCCSLVFLLSLPFFSVLLHDELGDCVDQVRAPLDHRLLHARGVGDRGVVHAEPLDGGVELVEHLLGDYGADGGADASGVGTLVEDGELVGPREGLSDGFLV